MNLIGGGGSHDDCLYTCTVYDEIGDLSSGLACGANITEVNKRMDETYTGMGLKYRCVPNK